ncbi:putative Pappalysin-2 [Amylocarpus encephaloides]|uniref:Pappalysin-2 n=1 Tax=Amylocarpus encephaloides TaxID=45428 RepID=A0A9P7YGS2_9HELO|nr:putative Pappalysin-2 [Amylocarpus encephaloides]
MKWTTTLAALAATITSVLAEDLLFASNLQGLEEGLAQKLGYTTKIVTETEWKAMTTADFASYKAIILGDDFGSSYKAQLQFLIDTKAVWGPAVTGNIIIHGADQSNHGKDVLINNSIKFAASGKASTGAFNTGLYFSLSQYYDTVPVANVEALSYFGTFEVRGDLSCYDKVHIVASHPAIDTLTDTYLSNWGCSVHEAFSAYPSVGLNGFQAIAIADGVVFPGTQNYGDGHSGLPYIITRGATPAGCGDGKWDASIGEECDDGNTVPGDGCSLSCKCESGLPKGDGTCYPSNSTTPSGPSGTAPPKSTGYSNSTITHGGTIPPYPTTPPYVTPAVPSVSVIGVEIVVSVTVSGTVTVPCSTYQVPIYNTQIATAPCYSPFCSSCAVSSIATSTYSGVEVSPTGGPVQFTGAAARVAPGNMMAVLAAIGAGAVGAAALVL